MILFDDHKFERLSVNDGLSQNTVYSFMQDKKGFMWICTQLGLNKYDGNNFTVYKNNPENRKSIQNDFLYMSFKDSENEIWFGALDGVFARYDKENNCFNNYQLLTAETQISIKSNISGMCEHTSEDLYISLFGVGLYNFNKAQENFFQVNNTIAGKSYNFSKVNSLLKDNEGNIWIGTFDEGLIKINFNTDKAEQYSFNENNTSSLSNNRIKFIFQDSKKIIWVGTREGLNRYDPERNNFRRYFSDNGNQGKLNISCIAEDKNNKLWIGAFNNGLIKFDSESENYSLITEEIKNPNALSSNSILSLYSDSSNVLWIGTFIDGINKIDCERKKFYNINNLIKSDSEIPSLIVSCIHKDTEDKIFLGTYFGGLYSINLKSCIIENYLLKTDAVKNSNDLTLTCIHKDSNNFLWLGSHLYGLYRFDTDSNESENYTYTAVKNENRIQSVVNFSTISDDFLWVGTLTDGLFRFDKRTKKFQVYTSLKKFNRLLSGNGIKCLLLDSSGILWIGTDLGGLNRLDFENGEIECFSFEENNPDSISDNYIVSLCEDRSNNLWIGTMNGGLNYFNKEKKAFKHYTTDNDLPDNTIRGILEDNEGNLWFSTNNGLSKFNPDDNLIRNYNTKDGLQSKEFNDGAFFKDNDGIFYFGGVNGFNFFKPEEIEDNPYIPDIAITNFQIFNHTVENSPDNPFLKKNITVTEEIHLTYKESVFSFDFTSLIFNNPLKNQYAYMMEGFDKDWIYCGTRRFVTYTSLKHGEYIFRVKGSNNDGIWNEKGESVRIIITPPFWKTWWFRSLGLMSVIGTTGLAYHQKLMKVEKEKLLQQDFSRRILMSQENERKKIATELHHTIAHDVLVTKNKISIGLKNTEDPEKVKSILSEISDLASNTLNDVRSISHSLHPHQLESLGLTKAIKSIINTVSKSTEITFSASIENIDNIFSKELEINIFRIIQECFNNILKHSKADKAMLNIIQIDNYIKIIISDNGIGFRKKLNSEGGIGMSETEERLKLYGGQYSIDSESGKGTIISILIPI